MAKTDYQLAIEQIKTTQANAGRPGFNEYGVPLHACDGHKHDGQYWAYVRAVLVPRLVGGAHGNS